MATTTINRHETRGTATGAPSRVRAGSIGLRTIGMVAIVVSAWAAIAPFVGPTFGYDPNGTGSWYWSLGHSLVALAPGALGLLMGFAIVASSSEVGRGRLSLAGAGTILLVAGAWVAVGPFAWRVIYVGPSYFASGSPFRVFTYEVGSAIGPGLIMAACGAFALGWASRHQRNLAPVSAAAPASAAPPAAPARPMTAAPMAAAPVAAAPVAAAPVASAPVAAEPVATRESGLAAGGPERGARTEEAQTADPQYQEAPPATAGGTGATQVAEPAGPGAQPVAEGTESTAPGEAGPERPPAAEHGEAADAGRATWDPAAWASGTEEPPAGPQEG